MLTYYLVTSSISMNISQWAEKLEFSFRKDSNSKVNGSINMNNKSERIEELLTYLPLPSSHVPFHLYYFETSNLFLS